MDAVFQRMIIELFGNACVDCGHSAATESGELCADHTEQKLSQPESRYDLAAAVCRCFDCHTKRHTGEVKRYPAKEKMPRQTQERAKKYTRPQCKCSPRCPMLPLENGYCIRSQPRKKS
jgi:cytochrome c553